MTSPGIPPFLADLIIVGLILSLVFALIIWSGNPGRTLYYTLGIDTVLITIIKIVANYYDYGDLILSCVALIAAIFVVGLQLYTSGNGLFLPLTILGILSTAMGLIKVLTDIYDPFDLVLACCAISVGVAILKETVIAQNLRDKFQLS